MSSYRAWVSGTSLDWGPHREKLIISKIPVTLPDNVCKKQRRRGSWRFDQVSVQWPSWYPCIIPNILRPLPSFLIIHCKALFLDWTIHFQVPESRSDKVAWEKCVCSVNYLSFMMLMMNLTWVSSKQAWHLLNLQGHGPSWVLYLPLRSTYVIPTPTVHSTIPYKFHVDLLQFFYNWNRKF